MITEKLLPACIGLSSFGLAAAFALQGSWILALVSAAVGFFWMITLFARWGGFSSFWLICQVCVNVIAFLNGIQAWIVLVGVLLAISAWDLELFIRRLEKVRGADARRFELRHLKRLGIVLAAGALLSAAALLIHVSFTFWFAFVLSVLALWGIYEAFKSLSRRHKNDQEQYE